MNDPTTSIDILKIASVIATWVAAFASLVTLIKAVMEYIKQGKLKRAESFSSLEAQLWQNPSFKKICGLLTQEGGEPELHKIDLHDKYAFLAFCEKIALMMNSGLITEDVAHYMFGYFAIACYESEAFWNDEGLDRNDPYWSMFCDFASRMKKLEKSFLYSKSKLKF